MRPKSPGQKPTTTSQEPSSKQVYFYTGEGKIGDQVMLRGNKAIADHEFDGTALRLFVAVGYKPGTGTRIHQYVGQFAVDTDLPCVVRKAPGAVGGRAMCLCLGCCQLVPWPLAKVHNQHD